MTELSEKSRDLAWRIHAATIGPCTTQAARIVQDALSEAYADGFHEGAYGGTVGQLHDLEVAHAEIERLTRERDDYMGRYETSHASRMHAEDCYRREKDRAEEAEAALDRVKALADTLGTETDPSDGGFHVGMEVAADRIRAAIRGEDSDD